MKVEIWGVDRNLKVFYPLDGDCSQPLESDLSCALSVVEVGSTAQFLQILIKTALTSATVEVRPCMKAPSDELLFLKPTNKSQAKDHSAEHDDVWEIERRQVIVSASRKPKEMDVAAPACDTLVLVIRERDIRENDPAAPQKCAWLLHEILSRRFGTLETQRFFVTTDLVKGPKPTSADAKQLIEFLAKAFPKAERVLITNSSAIRNAGFRVRTGGSTSASVEDICNAILDEDEGNALFWGSFNEIVVRIRGDAILHLTKSSLAGERWTVTLVYTLDSDRITRSHWEDALIGADSILTACLINPEKMLLKEAIVRVENFARSGYCIPQEGPSSPVTRDILEEWIVKQWSKTEPKDVDRKAANLVVNRGQIVQKRGDWNMLEAVLDGIDKSILSNDDSLVFFAKRIVQYGCEDARLQDPSRKDSAITVPLRFYKLGKIITANRAEVDGLTSLQRLMVDYIKRERGVKGLPLCVAVFGPPGSGKSFGVKQIAKSLAEQEMLVSKEKPKEFNVAQFTALADLANALHQVRDQRLSGVVPVAIFDEFDADFQGQPFGWLKYFLMPMQDGKFVDGRHEFHTGNCILVFAGGINANFAEFSGRQRDRVFCNAKGPDFISRLRAAHDVPSLNPDDSDSKLWLIRRAILLRSYLEQQNIRIRDPDIIKALLEVETYRHGARSLEAVVSMCSFNRNREIDRASLPPRNQLDLHLDSLEFWNMLASSKLHNNPSFP